jgi:hypothetical protein
MHLSKEWTVASFVFSRSIMRVIPSSTTSPPHFSAVASAKFLPPCRRPRMRFTPSAELHGQVFATNTNVNVFPSQAECNLDLYSQGGYSSGVGYCSKGGHSDSSRGSRGELGWGNKCFGCKGPHPYIKNKVIVCPNKDKPGVRAAAEKAYQEWLEKLCKRNKKRKDLPLDYNKLNGRDKASMQECILASLCICNTTDEASKITTDSTHPCDSRKNSPTKQAKMTILVVDLLVLSSASHNKSILLAPIVTNFHHIHLQLGTALDCPKCTVLRCVVDTAPALTTGNFHFVAAFAKRYPHCVAKIFVPEDYNPIVLSGIVQCGGEFVTTKLMVEF